MTPALHCISGTSLAFSAYGKAYFGRGLRTTLEEYTLVSNIVRRNMDLLPSSHQAICRIAEGRTILDVSAGPMAGNGRKRANAEQLAPPYKKKARHVPTETWSSLKDDVYHRYIVLDQPLDEIMRDYRHQHDFHASYVDPSSVR